VTQPRRTVTNVTTSTLLPPNEPATQTAHLDPLDLVRPHLSSGSVAPSLRRPPGRLGRAASAVGWATVGLSVLIGLWALAASRVHDLPSPARVFTEMRTLFASPFHDNGPNDKGIGLQLLASLQRVAIGFGMAALVGIPLGFAMGASRRMQKASNPVVNLLRPVSPLAWFPIWLIVLKDAPKAAVWVLFITALWPVVVNTAAGAASVPRDQRNVAKVFQLNRRSYLKHVLVPHTLPSVVTGLRLAMGVAWMVIVAVEMLSGGSGIGFFVWDSYNGSNIARVIAAIVLIGGVGVLLDMGFLRLGKAVAAPEVAS
jgi:nitrate/nitrite transport system permease protein